MSKQNAIRSMEVPAADAASWVTIKSNVCKMFPFDFSK